MEKNHAATSTAAIKAISKNISDGMTGNRSVGCGLNNINTRRQSQDENGKDKCIPERACGYAIALLPKGSLNIRRTLALSVYQRRRDRARSRSERAGHHRERLSDADAAELERLVGASHFFDLPPAIGVPPRGAADYHRYTVTIHSGTCRHTVQLTEPIADPAIHRLVAFLRAQAKVFRKR